MFHTQELRTNPWAVSVTMVTYPDPFQNFWETSVQALTGYDWSLQLTSALSEQKQKGNFSIKNYDNKNCPIINAWTMYEFIQFHPYANFIWAGSCYLSCNVVRSIGHVDCGGLRRGRANYLRLLFGKPFLWFNKRNIKYYYNHSNKDSFLFVTMTLFTLHYLVFSNRCCSLK